MCELAKKYEVTTLIKVIKENEVLITRVKSDFRLNLLLQKAESNVNTQDYFCAERDLTELIKEVTT